MLMRKGLKANFYHKLSVTQQACKVVATARAVGTRI